ncbi:hypothetical protein WA026_002890 [Henosepilachna vigintioctopunctata]|uniref:Uncharacterized protein n=1 Tax=Henosepilachna vigintioctopunctata TaxID=420089 RepID=A0AAW1TLV9_9CUCU
MSLVVMKIFLGTTSHFHLQNGRYREEISIPAEFIKEKNIRAVSSSFEKEFNVLTLVSDESNSELNIQEFSISDRVLLQLRGSDQGENHSEEDSSHEETQITREIMTDSSDDDAPLSLSEKSNFH